LRRFPTCATRRSNLATGSRVVQITIDTRAAKKSIRRGARE